MSNQLSKNLHDKMEITISQYIEELYDLDVIDNAKVTYESHRFINLTFETYLINNIMFDNNSDRHIKSNIFDKIANHYFNEEDKNELKQYYKDYFKPLRRKYFAYTKWYGGLYDLIFIIAHMFSKTNKEFIKLQIEGVRNNTLK